MSKNLLWREEGLSLVISEHIENIRSFEKQKKGYILISRRTEDVREGSR